MEEYRSERGRAMCALIWRLRCVHAPAERVGYNEGAVHPPVLPGFIRAHSRDSRAVPVLLRPFV